MPQWVRDFLILPLVVGTIVAAFTFSLPHVIAKKKELSYAVDGPIGHLDDPAIGHVEIQVNGQKVSDLVAYKAHIWNSGDEPLKELPVRFVFDTSSNNFVIFSTSHRTEPEYEFGAITEDKSEQFSRRFVFSLLNPGDRDTITFLTNAGPSMKVFAKSERLSVEKVSASPTKGFGDKTIFALALLATLASVLMSLLKALTQVLSEETKNWIRRTLNIQKKD